MRRIAISHFKILVVYLAVITVLRWELPTSLRVFSDLSGLWVGGFIGLLLLDVDRLIQVYIERPGDQLSVDIQGLVRNGKWREAIGILVERRYEQHHLAFRNAIFGLVFLPVVFFAFTSTSGLFGKGLAAGVMLHFLYDAWRDYLRDRERFSSWFMWMIEREVPLQEQKIVLWIITGTFGFMSMLLF